MANKNYNLVLTEILQKECEIEAKDMGEALEILEQKYALGEIYLDYSDLKDTQFSNSTLLIKEMDIMDEITKYCSRECCSCDNCPEDECILFRIQKIIEGM